jgi:hypothetical protein
MRTVLTIRQPWAWAIFHAGKDVENRRWSTKYRGRLYVHAGLAVDDNAVALLRATGFDVPSTLPRGVILGAVTIVDIVREHDSRWAQPHHFHWLLRDAALLRRPLPHRGKRGLHRV